MVLRIWEVPLVDCRSLWLYFDLIRTNCICSLGSLVSGALTNIDAGGWRYIFWLQAAFHLVSSLGLLCFYWPQEHIEYPKMSVKEYIWACDPIGSFLFICSATLMLLALDWAGGDYAWSSAMVAAPLTIGIVLLVLFLLYGTLLKPHESTYE